MRLARPALTALPAPPAPLPRHVSAADLQRGYWDDMAELRRDGGKLAPAPAALTPAHEAMPFPGVPLLDAAGAAAALPPRGARATLLGVLAVAGAQRALDTWLVPFAAALAAERAARHAAPGSTLLQAAPPAGGPRLALAQLALVESAVMGLPGLRALILRGGSGGGARAHTHPVFHFGDAKQLRRQLGAPNRMAAYVFLLDAAGRVRWRGSGAATGEEVDAMLRCAAELAEER